MSSVRIKILEEKKSSHVRKVDGYSGTIYKFPWDDKLRAYVFTPKDQRQLDDILKRPGNTKFCPVIEMGNDAPTVAKPVVSAADQEQIGILGSVLAMAGIERLPTDGVETVQRLLRAYDKGREDERGARAVATDSEHEPMRVIDVALSTIEIPSREVVELPHAEMLEPRNTAKAGRGGKRK